MKIYHWIDKYNYKNCFKIITKYSHGISAKRKDIFYLHTSFYGKYVLRLFLVLVSLIFLKKSTYQTFYKLISTRHSAFVSIEKHYTLTIKFIDFISTLFGYRYFVDKEILPLLSSSKILDQKLNFPINPQPLVSIIIPVYNHLEYTFNCLASIKNNVSEMFSYEIIVIDDGSKDATEHFFNNNTKGITYIRNHINQGFLKSCNICAKHAKGTFVVFLNNDIQVRANWLESLLKTIQQENVGCVGSKLIYANGLLQEAGGIVFDDASALNYGRYQDPNHPAYNYSRAVDYCSGASIMLRKVDFETLNFFDERYTPAYYEDTDICFAVQHQLFKKVIYQPLSSLIHFEGISSGTDVENDPVKNFQKRNKIKFQNKWVEELKHYSKPNDIINGLNKYLPAKTILIIDDVIPAPDMDSGSLRLFEILKIIKSLGYHVIFVPNNTEKRKVYFENLVLLGVEVLYRFPNRKAMLKLLADKMPEIDYVWICKPQNNAPFEFLFNLNNSVKRIYDTIDLHFLRMQGEAILNDNQMLLNEAAVTKAEEISLAKKANITIAITNDEKRVLEKEGITNVVVIPNIHEEVFSEVDFKAFDQREGLLFIGGYAHRPNQDAAIWMVNKIMPIVWASNSSIKLILLGSNPTVEVLNLRSDNVSVPGYIDDVSSYFKNAKIFVAPLRFGAGMKGKIGQSLSFALPVVTTEIGAEGIGLVAEKNYLQAGTEVEFANQILRLYEDRTLWYNLSSSSLELIKQFHPAHARAVINSFLPNINL